MQYTQVKDPYGDRVSHPPHPRMGVARSSMPPRVQCHPTCVLCEEARHIVGTRTLAETAADLRGKGVVGRGVGTLLQSPTWTKF